MAKKVKWALIILSLILVLIYSCKECETISLVTENESLTLISSPFEETTIDSMKANILLKSLEMMILTKENSEQQTREVVYQVNIYGTRGHTEEVISYGKCLQHYYDRQCIGEYYVPLITRVYLRCLYGAN